nr:RHS repeat-associated core domain-containing protein [Paracidovorax konjaci]
MRLDLRYPGQEWDEETGLNYNLHRYYDPATGRYMQADPIGLAGGWNPFIYTGGNPTSFIDPTGLASVMLGGQPWESPMVNSGSSRSPMIPHLR